MTTKPPPPHRATTANLQAIYPFVTEGGLGDRGTYIGRDLFGGSFCFDPWELYARGLLTGPNMVVVGQIGRGKSTFVKTFIWRQLVFGRQAWIIDPKGEYGPLAAACGTQPLRIAPGGPLRLNPLDPGPAGHGSGGPATLRRQAELLGALASASLGRRLSPSERAATDVAVGALARTGRLATLPALVAELLDPDPRSAAELRTSQSGLAADGRDVALELRRLVEGDLAGMFDGPTTPGIDLGASLVVLDLSALYASPALGILMTCATAWLQSILTAGDDVRRLVVVDEAWAVLHDLAIARWMQSAYKLSRAFGVSNLAVVHRLSDLRAAGGVGSQVQQLAEGLLADAETRVIFGQPHSEIAGSADLLGLSRTEAELLPQLRRGVALWKVGQRSFLIEHRVGRLEQTLVDTDSRMGT